jgi:hypothetical protein
MTTRFWIAVLSVLSLAGPSRADTPGERLAPARDAHKEAVANLLDAFGNNGAKSAGKLANQADEK